MCWRKSDTQPPGALVVVIFLAKASIGPKEFSVFRTALGLGTRRNCFAGVLRLPGYLGAEKGAKDGGRRAQGESSSTTGFCPQEK